MSQVQQSDESAARDAAYFGIGCFHFGIKTPAPFHFNGREYLEKLRQTLEASDNIANVTIDAPPDLLNTSQEVTATPTRMNEGCDYFPSGFTAGLELQFSIHIPFRVQADLIDTTITRLETFTEDFLTSIYYRYHGPVAFVTPINPTAPAAGSIAVMIVREFLRRHFSRQDKSYIRFEVLGPSPFHADCAVTADESMDATASVLFQSTPTPRLGYDLITFSYAPTALQDLEHARTELFDTIPDELGLFYEIVQLRSEQMYRWDYISGMMDQLVAMQRDTGLRPAIRRAFKTRKLITLSYLLLADYEAERVLAKSTIERDYADSYSQPTPHFFRKQIDNEISRDFVAPTDASLRIVELADKRHTKRIDTIVVLTSSVLGGAIGSLLTLWLSQ
jgi:hypothetical protein